MDGVTSSEADPEPDTLSGRVGGLAFFEALVEGFYGRVESDPRLRPLYPRDLTDARAHLALFLDQYFGGPQTYGEVRGHPRLRMRHAPFVIGPMERDAWLAHMTAAVGEATLGEADRRELTGYFTMAAASLQNH